MQLEFKMPDVGEGIAEGEIVKWLVKEGDAVRADQAIVQIETDKAVVDLPSPKSGVILKIHFKEGQVVKVGESIVTIGDSGDKVAGTDALYKKEKKTDSVVGQLEEAPDEEPELKKQISVMRGESSSLKVLAAPAVRRYAADSGVELTKIKGSGDRGEVLMRDISSLKGEISQQSIGIKREYHEHGYAERIPLKGIRKTIAENMIKSVLNAPQVTLMEDADSTSLWNIKEKEKRNLSLADNRTKLTLLPFIAKAVIAVLKEYPLFNSSIEGDEIVIKKYYNIGIAVETDLGLVVPVLKNAEHKSILEIASEIFELADKARSRKLSLGEMSDGTFTITNYGSVGGTYATPIINPGECAILGMGRIYDKVVSQGEAFKTIKCLPLSLTFDHRIVDGAEASRFLEKFRKYIEEPEHLMLQLD